MLRCFNKYFLFVYLTFVDPELTAAGTKIRFSRGKRWSHEENVALLSIWEDPQVAKEVATYKSVYKPVFQHITDRLNSDFGFDRNREQVSVKIRDMRKLYRLVLERGKYGRATKDTWPYFEVMQRIVGNETTVTPPNKSAQDVGKVASGSSVELDDIVPDSPTDEGDDYYYILSIQWQCHGWGRGIASSYYVLPLTSNIGL